MRIRLAENPQDIARCYDVMVQLRPHLGPQEFVERVQRQAAQGYVLAYAEDGGAVVALAGFREMDMLARGRTIYVDDLVTDTAVRSKGYGAAMVEWLADHARALGCDSLELDSGVHRFDAHHFYFREGMYISCYHFALDGDSFRT